MAVDTFGMIVVKCEQGVFWVIYSHVQFIFKFICELSRGFARAFRIPIFILHAHMGLREVVKTFLFNSFFWNVSIQGYLSTAIITSSCTFYRRSEK